MAEDKFEPREIDFRQWLPWTHLFRGFWVAFDYKKLLLAAAGILVMSCGWWVLSYIFYELRAEPKWDSGKYNGDFAAFREARNQWNLFYKAAGPKPVENDANDLAETKEEYDQIVKEFSAIQKAMEDKTEAQIRREMETGQRPRNDRWLDRGVKRYGELSTWPFFEDRGPNPFLLVTGQVGQPWEGGHFFDWFVRHQAPVLLEPLFKFLRPVFYFLDPRAGFVGRLYFLLVIVWTVATWAVFGGAITRIAAVQIARNEKIGMMEAIRYTLARWRSYLFASFAPLLGLAAFTLLLILFGIGNLIPMFAELWNGLLWFVPLGIGLIMAVVLVGLVGWPMIHATLGAEGSDSFDALSRSYSYVIQKPWSYLWYVLVALVYGAVVVFFVGFMGSLTVYLAKWGVGLTTAVYPSRDPSYMCIYAPTSFGWRQLLLQGSPVVANTDVTDPAKVDQAVDQYVHNKEFHGWNYIGPWLIAIWLYLIFLMIVGFGYSYFWSASTIIYFLMRRKVDDTEMDEVYLEEEDSEESYSAPATPSPTTSQPAPAGSSLQMVEPPSMRPSTPPAGNPPPAPAPMESSAPSPGDGDHSGESPASQV